MKETIANVFGVIFGVIQLSIYVIYSRIEMRSKQKQSKISSPVSHSSDSVKTIQMRIEDFQATLPSPTNQQITVT